MIWDIFGISTSCTDIGYAMTGSCCVWKLTILKNSTVFPTNSVNLIRPWALQVHRFYVPFPYPVFTSIVIKLQFNCLSVNYIYKTAYLRYNFIEALVKDLTPRCPIKQRCLQLAGQSNLNIVRCHIGFHPKIFLLWQLFSNWLRPASIDPGCSQSVL